MVKVIAMRHLNYDCVSYKTGDELCVPFADAARGVRLGLFKFVGVAN